MSTRSQNEKKFDQWDELAGGGRRYRLDVPGRSGWLARYLKEVDTKEKHGGVLAGDLRRQRQTG
jgi:hypothetical protein